MLLLIINRIMSEVEKNLDAALNGASIETNGDQQPNDDVHKPEVTYVNKNEYEVDTSDEEVISDHIFFLGNFTYHLVNLQLIISLQL